MDHTATVDETLIIIILVLQSLQLYCKSGLYFEVISMLQQCRVQMSDIYLNLCKSVTLYLTQRAE